VHKTIKVINFVWWLG